MSRLVAFALVAVTLAGAGCTALNSTPAAYCGVTITERALKADEKAGNVTAGFLAAYPDLLHALDTNGTQGRVRCPGRLFLEGARGLGGNVTIEEANKGFALVRYEGRTYELDLVYKPGGTY